MLQQGQIRDVLSINAYLNECRDHTVDLQTCSQLKAVLRILQLPFYPRKKISDSKLRAELVSLRLIADFPQVSESPGYFSDLSLGLLKTFMNFKNYKQILKSL